MCITLQMMNIPQLYLKSTCKMKIKYGTKKRPVNIGFPVFFNIDFLTSISIPHRLLLKDFFRHIYTRNPSRLNPEESNH